MVAMLILRTGPCAPPNIIALWSSCQQDLVATTIRGASKTRARVHAASDGKQGTGEAKRTSRLLLRACMELALRKSVARFAGLAGIWEWGRLLYLHSGSDTDVSFGV